MNYAIYNRKSQESEDRQAQSIEDQKKLNLELAGRLGISVNQEYILDESFSAKDPELRSEFKRLLHLIKTHKISGIIAWHPDRLSRNEIDAAQICYLIRKGILKELIFVNYTFDNSPEGMMMLQMALSQSQYYSSKLSKDVLRGLNSKIEKGQWPHRAPEGYRNDMENHTIITDTERLPLIKKAFQLLLTGAYTVQEVLTIMNEDWAYKTRPSKKIGGKKLTRSAAYRLFSNIFYTGRMERKGVIVKGAHEAILSLNEYERVQEIIGKGKYKKRTFAFNGLMRCKHCGRAVVGTQVKNNRHGNNDRVYYACGNTKCPTGKRKSIKEHEMEQQVDQILKTITWPDWFKEVLFDEVRHYLKQELGDYEENITRQNNALIAAQNRRSSLLDMRLDNLIDNGIFQDKERDLTAEINRLDDAMQKAKNRLDVTWKSITKIAEFIIYAEGTYKLGNPHQCREILATLGAEYAFDNGSVEITVNPLLPYNLGTFKHLIIGSGKQKELSKIPDSSFWLGLREYVQEIIAHLDAGVVFPEIEYIK